MKNITKVLVTSFITNAGLSLLKIIFGLISKSGALVADGFHSISDLSTDIVAIIGNKLSLKPADKEHPFGHGKTEYVTSLIIGFLIIIIGLTLIYNAFNKEIIIPSIIVSLVSLFTIFSKIILANYIYKNGVKFQNNILIASGKESRADAYSSIFVLASIILMQFSDKIEILKYTDLVGTIIIAIFIIRTGYSILKDNISILLEEQILDKKYLEEINKLMLSFDEVISIEDLHILRYGPYYKLIANIIMKEKISLSDAHTIVDDIEDKIKGIDEKIKYVFVHMEPSEKIHN